MGLCLVQVVVGLPEEVATLLEYLRLPTCSPLYSSRSRCSLVLGYRMQVAFGLAISDDLPDVIASHQLSCLVILNPSIAGH